MSLQRTIDACESTAADEQLPGLPVECDPRPSAEHVPPGGTRNAPRGGILNRIEAWLLRRLLARLGHPPVTVVLWTGEEFSPSSGGCHGQIVIHSEGALRRLLRDPLLAFGDLYAEGEITITGNPVECLVAIFQAMRAAPPMGFCGRWFQRLRPQPHARSSEEASRNVHRHYDLGNAFFEMWLDAEQLYSCAYFRTDSMTLEQAQVAKMDHICRKLRLRPGQRVVDVGCGWGALPVYMARRYGVSVRAFNLSEPQIEYARRRVRNEGLEARIELIRDDFRNMSGTCDALVSVGMLEHVGPENYSEMGRVMDRLLTRTGRGLMHSIGRNVSQPMDRWTERRIFPGTRPPSLREMMELFEPFEFSVLDVENLRLHYARTLEEWLTRFQQSREKVVEMFDERFARTWEFYLASSSASFTTGYLQLFQVLFARAEDNQIPWTRRHVYDADLVEALG